MAPQQASTLETGGDQVRVRIAAPMVVALLASQSFMALPTLASHVTRETVVIDAGDGGQYDPAIRGDFIAYTDTSTGDADIVVKSISTGSTTRISGSPAGGAQENEDIDGNYVVFRHWVTGVTEAEIFVYNLATGVYTQITDDAFHQTDPAISGTRIVWTQFDSDGFSAIFTANIDGTGVQAIAPAAGVNQIDPAISGNTVVWYEGGNIVSVDLSVTLVVKTTVATGADRWPDVNGTKIAYGSAGNIFVRDGATTTQLTSDATTQRRPKVSSTLVAWENLVAPGDTDIGGWDFRINAAETLVSGPGVQEIFDLDGTSLAYTERSNDAAGDIYLLREVVPLLLAPFAAFTAEVEITLGPLVLDDSFEVQGEFTLGAGSDGIDPPTEEVTFAVGTSLPTVIPPGSFEQDAEGSYRFESGSLEFVITPLLDGSFAYKVEGENAELTLTTNPVEVSLTIGDDSSTTTDGDAEIK